MLDLCCVCSSVKFGSEANFSLLLPYYLFEACFARDSRSELFVVLALCVGSRAWVYGKNIQHEELGMRPKANPPHETEARAFSR